ncbi:MAG: nucleotidyltransferase domain-containing protein [Chloroflexi bacterium]|nr:nucleotidyltransferase domain-containing protein [Chloroflexota bacterium]
MNTTLAAQPACLPEVVNRIVRKFNPLRIILFGSWARGEARPDSDVDLLVVLPEVEHKRRTAIEILRVLNGVPISKDIVVTTPEEIKERGRVVGNILLPALTEGKIIYERR